MLKEKENEIKAIKLAAHNHAVAEKSRLQVAHEAACNNLTAVIEKHGNHSEEAEDASEAMQKHLLRYAETL